SFPARTYRRPRSPWRYALKKKMHRRPAPSEPCPWGLLALIFLSWAARVCSGAESVVLVSGNVYTADDRNPRARAVVAAHGRILYVGANADALRRAPPGARRMDMHGLTILPGLTDSHAHLDGEAVHIHTARAWWICTASPSYPGLRTHTPTWMVRP